MVIEPSGGVFRIGGEDGAPEPLAKVRERLTVEIEKTKAAFSRRLSEVVQGKEQLLVQIMKVRSDVVVKAIDEKIEALIHEGEELKAKISKIEEKLEGFGTAFETVVGFIESPYTTWSDPSLKRKRLLLRAVFPGGLPYHFENGFGTTDLCCVLKVFQQIGASSTHDVEMGGIEPPSRDGYDRGFRMLRSLGRFSPSCIKTTEST